MSKKILTNLFLLLAINLVIKPFWILGIDRTVQNTVGNHDYGSYMIMFNISLLFTMFLDFGINNYTSTFIAKHKHLLNKKFATLFPLKLIFSAAYFVITLSFGLVFGYTGKPFVLLLILAFNQVLAYFILFFRANISGLQMFRTDAFLSVTDRGMMIVFAGLLMLTFTGNFKIEYFIAAQTLGYLSSFAISFWVLKKPLQSIKLNFNKLLMWSMIRQSWPYALLALLMTVYMRADILIMKKILPDGVEQTGVYAVATRLLEAANMMAVLVATMLLPLFSNMIKAKQDLSSLIKMSMLLLIIPSVGVAALAWFYNTEIMLLLSKTSPIESAAVFKYVMISFIAMCTMYIFGTLLTANGNLKLLNTLAAIALLINIVINILLQPKLGAQGAAIAAVCTHGFIAVTNMFFANKKLGIKLSIGYLLRLLSVLLVTIFMVGLLHVEGFNFLLAALLAAVASVILLFVTRLFNIQQFKQLLQNRL